MPTLARLKSGTINMYAGDHNPPHFHVRSNSGAEAWVQLSTLAVMHGGVNKALLNEAITWAQANKPLLQKTWKALNS